MNIQKRNIKHKVTDNKIIKKIVLLTMLVVLVVCGLSGCKVNSEKIVMKVGDANINFATLSYYAYTSQASYEAYYIACDKEVDWDSEVDSETLEAQVKNSVLSGIITKYTLVNHATDFGINVNEIKDDDINQMVDEYISGTADNLQKKIGAGEDELFNIFKVNTIYNMIYSKIMEDNDIEASDEDNGVDDKMEALISEACNQYDDGVSIDESAWNKINFDEPIFTLEDLK